MPPSLKPAESESYSLHDTHTPENTHTHTHTDTHRHTDTHTERERGRERERERERETRPPPKETVQNDLRPCPASKGSVAIGAPRRFERRNPKRPVWIVVIMRAVAGRADSLHCIGLAVPAPGPERLSLYHSTVRGDCRMGGAILRRPS